MKPYKVGILFLLVLAAVIYPPMQIQGISLDRAWLFNKQYDRSIIDIGRLLIDFVLIALIGLVLYFSPKFDNEKTKTRALLFFIPLIRICNILIFTIIIISSFGTLISLWNMPYQNANGTWSQNENNYWAGDPIIQQKTDFFEQFQNTSQALQRAKTIQNAKNASIAIALLLAIYFSNKKLINWLYGRLYGRHHPSLKKFWST